MHHEGGSQYNQLANPFPVGNSSGWPSSFCSCLRHCSEHTGHAVIALTESLYFSGNLASLAIPSQSCAPMATFLWIQVIVSTSVSVARAHTRARESASWLPADVRTLWAGMWKIQRMDASDSYRITQMSDQTSWPHKDLFMIVHLPIPIVQAIGSIHLQQPNGQCKS